MVRQIAALLTNQLVVNYAERNERLRMVAAHLGLGGASGLGADLLVGVLRNLLGLLVYFAKLWRRILRLVLNLN